MMEQTPPDDSDLAIDLQAIYTLLLSEAIGVNVTQSAGGANVLKENVLSYRGIRVVVLCITAMECYSLKGLCKIHIYTHTQMNICCVRPGIT